MEQGNRYQEAVYLPEGKYIISEIQKYQSREILVYVSLGLENV